MSDGGALARVWQNRAYKCAKQREWRAANPEKSRYYSTRSYKKRRSTKEGWLAHVITTAQRRARCRGVPFDLTTADFTFPEVCQFTGHTLKYGAPQNDPDGASIDRVIPAFGYVKGNVRIISRYANMVRHDCLNPALFRALADDAEAIRCRCV